MDSANFYTKKMQKFDIFRFLPRFLFPIKPPYRPKFAPSPQQKHHQEGGTLHLSSIRLYLLTFVRINPVRKMAAVPRTIVR